MPILDGMPSSVAELNDAMGAAGPLVERILGEGKFTPKQQSVIDLVKGGMSLGDILKITKEEREVMYVQGCRLIQVGEVVQARNLLTVLYMFDPLEARVIYALATTFQLQGDVAHAAKLYVQFLALDATNADGYLRLGECHLTAGELQAAAGLFRAAKGEADRGNGTPATAERAAQLLKHVEERTAKPS
jgi:thioredoxin-like negative regulator of GroEL